RDSTPFGTLGKGRSEVSIRENASKQITLFTEHTESVKSLFFSPDSRLVVSASGKGAENEVKIWEAATGKVRWEIKTSIGNIPLALFVHFSPDSRYVALCDCGFVNSADSRRVRIVSTS